MQRLQMSSAHTHFNLSTKKENTFEMSLSLSPKNAFLYFTFTTLYAATFVCVEIIHFYM